VLKAKPIDCFTSRNFCIHGQGLRAHQSDKARLSFTGVFAVQALEISEHVLSGSLEHVHVNLPPLNAVIMVTIPRRGPVDANDLSDAFARGNVVLFLEREQKFAAHRVVVQLAFGQ
jgi:hypothetical protein